MAPATSYPTEPDLAEFMRGELGSTVASLTVPDGDPAWTQTDPPGQYQVAIDNTLEAYGVATVDLATHAPRVRGLARYYVWDAVVKHLVATTNWSADGASYSDEQIYQHAVEQRKNAERAGRRYSIAHVDVGREVATGSLAIEFHP